MSALPFPPHEILFKKVLFKHNFAERFSKMPGSDFVHNNTAKLLSEMLNRDVGDQV